MNRVLGVFVFLSVVVAGCSKGPSPTASPMASPAVESAAVGSAPAAEVAAAAKQAASMTPEQARAELTRRGIAYTAPAFLDSAGSGNLAVVKLFVRAGMDIETKNPADDFTALHTAVWAGHLEVVQYLVEQGASLTAKDEDGWTPLHLAAGYDRIAVVQYLVEQGADLKAKNYGGRIPSDVARSRGLRDIAAYLDGPAPAARAELTRQGIAYTADTFLLYAQMGNLAVVTLFVTAGMDIETKNPADDFTALHTAATYGHLEVVKYLVGAGATVDAKGKNDETPLIWAAQNGHLEVVKYLVGLVKGRPILTQRP